MNHRERRIYLIKWLFSEKRDSRNRAIPDDEDQQKHLLRALMNVRPPGPVPDEVLAVQDEYLRKEMATRGIMDSANLTALAENLFLWQGDITRLRCDAIVNAANSGMTGCYVPCHSCIDNCIHTYAGMQLRLECAKLMAAQGKEEKTGTAKITGAYNLPCKYILHTVGPIVMDAPTERDKALLASCYSSCLALAQRHGIRSIAFCCISTGVFRFPNELAAEIAVSTVRQFCSEHMRDLKIIFNVFKDTDYEIYHHLIKKA